MFQVQAVEHAIDLTVTYWTGGWRWSNRVLLKVAPKGALAVCLLVSMLFITIGIGARPIGLILVAAGILPMIGAVSIAGELRKGQRREIDQRGAGP